MANGGKGYGSVWNMAVLAVLSVGLVVGLVLLGLFEVEDSFRVSTCVPSDEEEFEMTLKPGAFSFRPVWEEGFRIPSQWYLEPKIVDNEGNFVENVELASG